MPHPILPHPIHILETLKLFHYHYLSKSMETPEVPTLPFPLFLFLSPSFPLCTRRVLGKGVYRNMTFYFSSFPHQNFIFSLWQRLNIRCGHWQVSVTIFPLHFHSGLKTIYFPSRTASILEHSGRFYVFVFSCVPSQLSLHPGF